MDDSEFTLNETINSSTNELNVNKEEQIHKKACKNCFKLHRKCNKKMPCDYCTMRGKPCEINPCIKKRGRPVGSTNKNKLPKELQEQKQKEAKQMEKKQKKLGRPKKQKIENQENEEKKLFMEDYTFSLDCFEPIAVPEQTLARNCQVCSSNLIPNAKFCTNCGIGTEEQDINLHSKLDNLRWKNTMLEQQLHCITAPESSNMPKTSSPHLPSWDYSSANVYSDPNRASGSIYMPSSIAGFSNPTTNGSSFSFDNICEPSMLMDPNNNQQDQMVNWAVNYDNSFRKNSYTFSDKNRSSFSSPNPNDIPFRTSFSYNFN